MGIWSKVSASRIAILTASACLAFGGCSQKTSATTSVLCPELAFVNDGEIVSSPANVTVHFHLLDCHGNPVPSSDKPIFKITEDGKEISHFEATAGTVSVDEGYETDTVLMLDLSGSITKSGNLPALKQAALQLVDRLLTSNNSINARISIAAFDGGMYPYVVVDYTNDADVLKSGLNSIECPGKYCMVETTNLYGAVVNGLPALDQTIAARTPQEPYLGGVFVLFTDGTDRAQDYTEAQAESAIQASTSTVITVGVGGEINESVLKTLGRDGNYNAASYSQLGEKFVEVADKLSFIASSHYECDFCSDRRNNAEHSLGITASASPPLGNGELTVEFSSDDFSGGCMLPSDSPDASDIDAHDAQAADSSRLGDGPTDSADEVDGFMGPTAGPPGPGEGGPTP